MDQSPLLQIEHISKRFGSISALDDVSFAVRAGQVTCLLGDNGAGKSTLIRILSGVFPPTSGRYLLNGQPVTFRSPREAMASGIATVHQDLALIPLLSVWRNFVLGDEPTRGAGPFTHIDVAAGRRVAAERLAELGVQLRDLDEPVGSLSGGERQSIAIARAMHRGASVLILDEPTAALGVRQATATLRSIAQAANRGLAVILITHNPQHAYAVGQRFIVLRRGRVHGDFAAHETSAEDLAEQLTADPELVRLAAELQQSRGER
jgi:simple sugar transport system ATP-binding protein